MQKTIVYHNAFRVYISYPNQYPNFLRCYDYPAELKENMYFSVETFAGHPLLPQTCRLEENILVTADGPVVFTLMEHMEEAMQ